MPLTNPYTKLHRCSRRVRNQVADDSHTENSLLVRRRTTRGKREKVKGLGKIYDSLACHIQQMLLPIELLI